VSWLQIVIFFLIGVYGGFIQMGVGYFLLAGLVLSAGYELVKANALKVLVNFIFTPFALVVFIINGQIDFAYGFILGIGNVMGGLLGSRLAVKKGAGFVKWVIIVVILLTAARYSASSTSRITGPCTLTAHFLHRRSLFLPP